MPETYRSKPGPTRNFDSNQKIKVRYIFLLQMDMLVVLWFLIKCFDIFVQENYRELNGEFVCNKCPKRFKPNEKVILILSNINSIKDQSIIVKDNEKFSANAIKAFRKYNF